MGLSNKKIYLTLLKLTLITLVSVTDGRAGAKIITGLVKDYLKKKKKISAPKYIDEKAFRNALSRLRKSGLVERGGWGLWKVTERGRKYIDSDIKKIERHFNYQNISSKNKERDIRTVIIFDIPEKYRRKRDDLRTELLVLGFQQSQKSVWTGNIALPKSFIEYLRDKNILSYIRVFSVQEAGTL